MRTDEGYCATCRFMIELTEEGRLRNHGSRTIYSGGNISGHAGACEGTGAFPVAIGDEDPTAAFSSEEREARCPVCKAKDAVARETNGRMYMLWHKAPVISQEGPEGNVCPGTWDPIEYV